MPAKLPDVFAQIARASLGVTGVLPAAQLADLIRSVRRTESDLDDRVRAAFDSLSESSQLIDSLGEMLAERQKKLVALREEYDRISQLSTLTADQADAVADSLQRVIGKSAVRERLYSFAINIVAGLLLFVVGVFASDWVKSLF